MPPEQLCTDEQVDWFEQDDFDDDYDDELECTWCGGEGWQENDDPLWYGFDVDWIPCQCCAGTGLRKHQTIF
jgi:DnaJ-class molecular chaperone